MPLHVAIENGASEGIVRMLFEAYPDAAKAVIGCRRELALHAALKGQASESIIRMLFDSHPIAVKKKTKMGRLPLHLAIEDGASEGVVRMLFDAYPDAIKEVIEEEDDLLPCRELALHVALKSRSSEPVIRLLFDAHPGAVEKKNASGMLPLHLAVVHGADEAITGMLLVAFPVALKKATSDGWLPLHLALEGHHGIVRTLFQAEPDAVKHKTDRGELPLHVAIEFKASEDIVRMLLEEFPGATKEKTTRSESPLHVALRRGVSETVVHMLLQSYPDAAKDAFDAFPATKRDAFGGLWASPGDLPLHTALKRGAPESILQALLSAHPMAAQAIDFHDKLPLQIALEQRVAQDTVDKIVNAYPDALKDIAGKGGAFECFQLAGNGMLCTAFVVAAHKSSFGYNVSSPSSLVAIASKYASFSDLSGLFTISDSECFFQNLAVAVNVLTSMVDAEKSEHDVSSYDCGDKDDADADASSYSGEWGFHGTEDSQSSKVEESEGDVSSYEGDDHDVGADDFLHSGGWGFDGAEDSEYSNEDDSVSKDSKCSTSVTFREIQENLQAYDRDKRRYVSIKAAAALRVLRASILWRDCLACMLARRTSKPAARLIFSFLCRVCTCGQCCVSHSQPASQFEEYGQIAPLVDFSIGAHVRPRRY